MQGGVGGQGGVKVRDAGPRVKKLERLGEGGRNLKRKVARGLAQARLAGQEGKGGQERNGSSCRQSQGKK